MKNLSLIFVLIFAFLFSCEKLDLEKSNLSSIGTGQKKSWNPSAEYCIVGNSYVGYQTWASKNYDVYGVCYNYNESNRATYGALYTWSQLDTLTIPSGWRIPTYQDFEDLYGILAWDAYYEHGDYVSCVGCDSVMGGMLKETGTTHWTSPNVNAYDDYGFTGLPAGYYSGGFSGMGTVAKFWVDTSFSDNYAMSFGMESSNGKIHFDGEAKTRYLSLRLIHDFQLPILDETNVLIATGRYGIIPDYKLINNTIFELKQHGIWDKADAFYVRGVNDSLLALQNWIENDHNGTCNGNITFTQFKGFQGNGSNAYINNDFIPSVDAENMTLTDASICFMQSEVHSGYQRYILGALNNTSNPKKYMYYYWYPSANDRMYLNSSTYNGNVNVTNEDFIGYSRIVDGYTIHQGYLNGDPEGAATSGLSTGTLVDYSIYELALNQNGTATGFNNGSMFFSYYGAALTASEQEDLYEIMWYFYQHAEETEDPYADPPIPDEW